MSKPKAKILVVFYSWDSSVEALAKAVSQGAREAGAEVRLRRCPKLSLRR
jgi:NAD(P)H dehydrogenase (quinone)